jgi:uncharacterized protein YjbI with pentapeptide repeats
MKLTIIFLSAFVILFFARLSSAQMPDDKQQWSWKDGTGALRTSEDLKKILEEHLLWLKTDGKAGAQAQLENADLSHASLTGVNLSKARLSKVNLNEATLAYADLSGAVMFSANLHHANLYKANLINVDLGQETVASECSDLSYAHLGGANLTGANLSSACMYRVNLRDTELKDAEIGFADLFLANFEPKSLPLIRGMAAVYNLEHITYDQNPDALYQLRKQFQDGGFRNQEREITYAIKTRGTVLLCPQGLDDNSSWWNPGQPTCTQGLFNKILFDLTCQYGLNYWRPIKMLIWLWALFSTIYFLIMHRSGRSGLYVVSLKNQSRSGRTHLRKIQRIRSDIGGLLYDGRLKALLRRELNLICASMMFSARSAFNIGFREFNFGVWLRSLTTREYDIQALGWVRTIAGIQSLISLYMVALWVLTYFGRPFD